MKILILCVILLTVNSLVPNCAFESNSKCLSCYYGFDLINGACNTCSTGFLMVKDICVDQALYQQQVNLQNQLNSLNVTTGTAIQQQPQTQTISAPPSTTSLSAQNVQVINQSQTTQNSNTVSTTSVPAQTVTTTSGFSSSSSSMTFDVSNTGVMYLLQIFGLTSKIPVNCQQFTPDFKCVKCITGYVVSSTSACIMQSTITTNTGTTSLTSQSTQSSSSSTSQSSGSITNSVSTGSTLTVTYSDPNCQIVSQNGDCSQCYFRYYYSSSVKKCVQVNDLCATWNNLGNCLACYGGYKLSNGICSIDYQAPTEVSTQGSTSSPTGSTAQITTSTGSSTQTSGSTSTSGSSITTTSSTGSPSQSSTLTTQTGVVTNQQLGATISAGSTVVITSSDPNCKTSGLNGFCYECYYSYYYNSQVGKCVSVNPLCQTWNYLGYCFSCFPGYILNGTQCVLNTTGNISSSSGTTNTGWSSASSSSSSSTSLSSSSTSTSTSSGVQNSGSSSSSNGQVILINSDPNCKTPNLNGTCSLCYNSFYYDSINAKKCVSGNPLCKTWNSLGYCLSCYQGYSLSMNSCIIESSYVSSILVGTNDLPSTNLDPNCNTYSNQVCIKCATRMYLDPTTKKCLAIDVNCMNWTAAGVCTSCYNGYYLNQNSCFLNYPEVASVQLKSSSNSDINCRASDSNGVCTQCIWRYVLNPTSKICMKVNDQCKSWSDTTALCTSCYGGYTLSSAGECKVSS